MLPIPYEGTLRRCANGVLVRELICVFGVLTARERGPMYKEVYVPVDNSDYSNQACVIGVDIARQFGGRVAGCHAYAAKMHDVRFRQMESGLPEEFRDEDEMKRQRKIHDQLITKGLEISTDSYIDVL